MSTASPEGEFRVPEDLESEQAERAALLTDDPAADATDRTDDTDRTDTAGGDDTDPTDDTAPGAWRRFLRRPAVGERRAPTDLADVDLDRTPGPVVGAVAFGVVAAPLLGVYAVLFITRYFLKPGVSPDITSSWTGEGISGLVAAVLALAVLVIVARAAGGRGLWVFVGAQVLVAAACISLLADDASGGRQVSAAVLVLSVAAVVLVVLPVSRRWFAAHTADRADA